MKLLHEILPAQLLAQVPAHVRALQVEQLAYDARRVRRPALYAAWQGSAADGHDHLAAAARAGAVCALVQRPQPHLTLPTLVCADPRRVLACAARAFYGAPDAQMALVAVTGTNGKTTCAQLVASVLAAWRGRSVAMGTLGTQRYGSFAEQGAGSAAPGAVPSPAASLTTAEAPELVAELRALVDAGCSAAALEASSIALDQGRLDGVLLDVAAWTNFTQDHLDYHGDMGRYRAAKERLFTERLKPHGVAVLNADDPAQAALAPARSLAFCATGPTGTSGRRADVYCRHWQASPQGMQLHIVTPAGELAIDTPLVGAFNVDNVLLAVAVATALKIPADAIRAGIAALRCVPGRMEHVRGVAGAPALAAAQPQVIVDYAHTPDALRRVLQAVRPLATGRVWCVFGCGGDRDAGKRGPMGRAVAQAADLAVVTSDNPRSEAPEAIAEAVVAGLVEAGAVAVQDMAALAACPPGAAHFCVALARAAAIRDAIARALPGDVVVLAGKGHETTQVIGEHVHPFDDRDHAARALRGWRPAAGEAAAVTSSNSRAKA